MKIAVNVAGHVRAARLPFEDAPHALVDVACPLCKEPAPLAVAARQSTRGHDTITGEGYAACCGGHIGTIVVTVATIFGIEEDERVLRGRPRVY